MINLSCYFWHIYLTFDFLLWPDGACAASSILLWPCCQCWYFYSSWILSVLYFDVVYADISSLVWKLFVLYFDHVVCTCISTWLWHAVCAEGVLIITTGCTGQENNVGFTTTSYIMYVCWSPIHPNNHYIGRLGTKCQLAKRLAVCRFPYECLLKVTYICQPFLILLLA